MKPKIVSKTIKYGNQHYRLNADKSWCVLGFGTTYNDYLKPHHLWIPLSEERVPEEVKNEAK